MALRFRELRRRMLTPLGRFGLLIHFYRWIWPVSRRVMGLYRRTGLRKVRFIAVIGSLGKTTTARALRAALLDEIDPPVEYNVAGPMAVNILKTPPSKSYRVLELGIQKPGVMAQSARMISPGIVVATSIKSEHWRSYPTPEDRRAEKATVLKHLRPGGIAVLNGDDPHILWMRTQTGARVITYGFNPENDVRAESVEILGIDGMLIRGRAHEREFALRTKLVGRVMAYPLLAAIAAAEAEGVPEELWKPRLEALAPSQDRLQPILLENGAALLCDPFKATEESVEAALQALEELPRNGRGRKILLMGRLEDPTEKDGPAYRRVGELAGRAADLVFHLGVKTSLYPFRSAAVAAGLDPDNFRFLEEDVFAAIDALRATLAPGDVALIKGRSTQKLERVAMALQGRKVACNLNPCPIRGIRCYPCDKLEKAPRPRPT